MEKILLQGWPSQEVLDQHAERIRLEIEQIDFGILRDIFSEYAERSGVDPSTINFQSADKIQILAQSRTEVPALFDSKEGILLNVSALERMNVEGMELAPNLRRILFHEETHASGNQNECSDEKIQALLSEKDEYGVVQAIETSGYRQKLVEEGKKRTILKLFNEGVTDLIAEEVYQGYHARLGEHTGTPFLRSYEGKPQQLVEMLVESLALKTGVQRTSVWESLVQGYFTGMSLRDEEVRQLFLDTFGIHIVDKLENIQTKDQIDEIITMLEGLNAAR
jgi:hypothetical protein